jgi:hypothetical protein
MLTLKTTYGTLARPYGPFKIVSKQTICWFLEGVRSIAVELNGFSKVSSDFIRRRNIVTV